MTYIPTLPPSAIRNGKPKSTLGQPTKRFKFNNTKGIIGQLESEKGFGGSSLPQFKLLDPTATPLRPEPKYVAKNKVPELETVYEWGENPGELNQQGFPMNYIKHNDGSGFITHTDGRELKFDNPENRALVSKIQSKTLGIDYDSYHNAWYQDKESGNWIPPLVKGSDVDEAIEEEPTANSTDGTGGVDAPKTAAELAIERDKEKARRATFGGPVSTLEPKGLIDKTVQPSLIVPEQPEETFKARKPGIVDPEAVAQLAAVAMRKTPNVATPKLLDRVELSKQGVMAAPSSLKATADQTIAEIQAQTIDSADPMVVAQFEQAKMDKIAAVRGEQAKAEQGIHAQGVAQHQNARAQVQQANEAIDKQNTMMQNRHAETVANVAAKRNAEMSAAVSGAMTKQASYAREQTEAEQIKQFTMNRNSLADLDRERQDAYYNLEGDALTTELARISNARKSLVAERKAIIQGNYGQQGEGTTTQQSSTAGTPTNTVAGVNATTAVNTPVPRATPLSAEAQEFKGYMDDVITNPDPRLNPELNDEADPGNDLVEEDALEDDLNPLPIHMADTDSKRSRQWDKTIRKAKKAKMERAKKLDEFINTTPLPDVSELGKAPDYSEYGTTDDRLVREVQRERDTEAVNNVLRLRERIKNTNRSMKSMTPKALRRGQWNMRKLSAKLADELKRKGGLSAEEVSNRARKIEEAKVHRDSFLNNLRKGGKVNVVRISKIRNLKRDQYGK